MKVSQENPGELLLKDNNISGFIGGIFFAAIGGGLTYVMLGAGDAPFWAPIIGLVFVALGLWIILSTKIVTIKLSKAGMCNFSTWSVLSRKARDVPRSSIKGLRLDRFLHSKHGGRHSSSTHYQYALVFLLDSGSELPFEFGKVNIGLMDLVAGAA